MGNKGSNTTTSSSTTAPDPRAMALYQDLLTRATGVANTPYTPYGGELVAPVNPQQTAGIGNINANWNYAQPFLQSAQGLAMSAANPITAADISQYMNPYMGQVVNATQNQFNNQNAQQQQQLLGNAAIQGALGGNRVGIATAELANNQQLAQAPVIANLMSQGYSQGVATALTEQQAKQAGAYSLGNLGVAGQSAALTGANAQVGAGTLQQKTQQQEDAARYGQFLQQMGYPFQTTQWLAGIGTGVGSQMGGTSQGTTTGPAPSPFGQIFGGLTSGAGILGASGAFGSAGWLSPALAALARGGAVGRAAGGVAPGPEDATVPETPDTLDAQQQQLIAGHRDAQMFPPGTPELPPPQGMERVEAQSGVFHYDPKKTDANKIRQLASQGRENEVLGLGPYSKDEVLARISRGEQPVVIVERTPTGTEVRAAIGTTSTAHAQLAAMQAVASPGNKLHIEDIRQTLAHRASRAAGGRVPGMFRGGVANYDIGGAVDPNASVAGVPYASAKGYIPGINLTPGRLPQANFPRLPGQQDQSKSLADQAKSLGGLANTIRLGMGSSSLGDDGLGNINDPGWSGGTPLEGSAPLGTSGIGSARRGGVVEGYADGGAPDFVEPVSSLAGQIYDVGLPPEGYAQGISPAQSAWMASGEALPMSGGWDAGMPADVPLPSPRPPIGDGSIPLPTPRPVDADYITPAAGVVPATPLPAARPVMGTNALSYAPSYTAPTADYASNIDRYGHVIKNMESGGDYSMVGPATTYKDGSMDHPYGAYGIMGKNIPEWTQQVLGHAMTPNEFLNSPEAQDAVFRSRFGQYVNNYGPEGASRAWFAGERGMNNPAARDVLGTSVVNYGRRFASALGLPTGLSDVSGVNVAQSANAPTSTELSAQSQQPSTAPNTAQGVAPHQGFDWDPNNKLWPALMAAGLGMLSSTSPFPGVAIGQGGLMGLQQYGAEQQREMQQQQMQLRARQLQNQMNIQQKELQLKGLPYQGVLTADQRMNLAIQQAKLEEERRQHDLALRTPVKIGQDRITGTDVYALPRPGPNGVEYYRIDPKTQQVDPSPMGMSLNNPALGQQPGARPPAAGAAPGTPGTTTAGYTPAAYQQVLDQAVTTQPIRGGRDPGSPEARDESFLQALAQEDPRYAANIKAIANYQLSPNALFSLRGNRREKVMGDVMLYDPTYDQRRYNQTNRAISGWAQSPEGRATRALSVTIDHLGTAERLGDALKNNNIPLLNSLSNTIATQLGHAAPSNFETAKTIVADEIAKAVIGGQNAESDRAGLQSRLSAASSPEQLQGVIYTFKELMAGQLKGLKHVYETATGLHNYDTWLTPNAAQELNAILTEPGRTTTTPVGAAPGAASTGNTPNNTLAKPLTRRVQNGYIYEQQPGGNWKAVGKAP